MLHQTVRKKNQTEKQKTSLPFLLIVSVALFVYQFPAYSQQYVVVDGENGDRLTGIWRGATETHFEIEYNGQVLRLPVTGYSLDFTSNTTHVPDRTAAKYFRNGRMLLELGLPEERKGVLKPLLRNSKVPRCALSTRTASQSRRRHCQRVGTLPLCGDPRCRQL